MARKQLPTVREHCLPLLPRRRIFEHLHTLVAPEPAPQQAQQHQGQQQQPQQQRQQQQQQQQQQQAVATADEGDTLELELGGSEGEGGSDADTADVAMAGGHGGGHGDGPGGRRLLSAVVKDEYRRHDSSGRRAWRTTRRDGRRQRPLSIPSEMCIRDSAY